MIQWSMILCFSLLFLIKSSYVNCIHQKCNYIVNKSDNSSSRCISDQCYKFLDLLSIMVEPKTCKTSLLFLSFSFYKNFIKFRDQLQWKIGDLFSSESINENRQLTLFLNQLDYNDRPFDHNELIHLGINIDFYILYIRNIQNKNYLYGSIHYDPNNPEWYIIKMKLRCLKLSAFDRYPCSGEIISPPLFAPQRPLTIFQSTTNITNLTSHLFSSTEESYLKSNEEKRKLTHLILIIIIPIIIILITMVLFILIYLCITRTYCFKRNIMSTSQTSSKTSTSNHPTSKHRNSSSSVSLSHNTIVSENAFNIEHVQNRTRYPDYHHHTNTHSTNNLNNNYEKVKLDNISVIGKQYFVPISSSIHF